MKKMKALKQFFKECWKPITAFTVLNFFMCYYSLIREDILNKKFAFVGFAFHFLLEIVLLAIYAVVRKKKWGIEKVFLALYIPIALVTLIITPMNQVPDEIGHIFRVDAISEGEIVAQKNEEGEYKESISKTFWYVLNNGQADRTIYKRIIKGIITGTDPEEYESYYDNTVSYNPVVYTPQVIGVVIGKFLHLPIVITMYLGRFFAMLAFAIICYFALKIMPKYKMFMMLIMMLPMTIQQSAAYTGDSMLFAIAFLLIACAFKYAYALDGKLSKKQVISIYVLSALIACCKSVVYLPIAFLFILIPKEKFKKPIYKWLHIILAVAIAGCVSMGWSMSQGATAQGSSDSLNYILTNPFEFITMSVGSALSAGALDFSNQAIGIELAYYTYEAAKIYTIIFFVLVTILIMRNTEKLQMKKMDTLLCWAIPIIITGMFFTVALTQWYPSRPENAVIEGVQGRYFTAFLPLIPFMLQTKKTEESKNPLSIDYIMLFIIFFNVCVITSKFFHNF